MDKRIRRNEICVIGQPRCDFVFSSTRTCFIAYGFEESTLEMTVLRNLLDARGIQPIEAGGSLAPAQNAFCAKICSKIITSQFCIVLLNNEQKGKQEIPNANVNMEYGLMLGFNKYVIPFQRASQTLPFNVAGLDTSKYTDQDFERLATLAIDQAIQLTRQDAAPLPPVDIDQILTTFLLAKKALVTPLKSDQDRELAELGRPLGLYLLTDFQGARHIYFGNYAMWRPEAALWRLRLFNEILEGRPATVSWAHKPKIWIILSTSDDKRAVSEALTAAPLHLPIELFTLSDDVRIELEKLTKGEVETTAQKE